MVWYVLPSLLSIKTPYEIVCEEEEKDENDDEYDDEDKKEEDEDEIETMEEQLGVSLCSPSVEQETVSAKAIRMPIAKRVNLEYIGIL
ncbi:hypothetical protein R83H12_00612 [Fibrobacteria bacterium R8-3-H12]